MQDEEDRMIDMWIAGIMQELHTATLGASGHMGAGVKAKRGYILPHRAYFTMYDVKKSRDFIFGRERHPKFDYDLKFICELIGLDYGETMETLRIGYEEAMKKVPKEYH